MWSIKIFLTSCLLVLCSSLVFAYVPNHQEKELLLDAQHRIDTLFPDDVETLLAVYDALESEKIRIRTRIGERGVHITKYIQTYLKQKLFAQFDVCVSGYVQYGDTVDITYSILNEQAELLREQRVPYVFNPGLKQTWLWLDSTVIWTQSGDHTIAFFPSVWVLPDDSGNTSKRVHLASLKNKNIVPYVGKEVVIWSRNHDVVVIWTITHISWDDVTIDFVDATTGRTISLTVQVHSLFKGCEE